MNGQAWLRLARVSNLPTVWTNVLAGMVLAGGAVSPGRTLVLLVALSLFYTGGMILNDAFDHRIDARDRPQRPIPSGIIPLETAFAAGFMALLLGLSLLLLAAYGFAPSAGWPALLAGIALAAAIVVYDWHHKANPLSPVFMALCRSLAYLSAGYAAASPAAPWLWALAATGGCYVIGLTYVARQENLSTPEHLWPLGFLALAVAGALQLAVATDMSLKAGLAILLYVGFVACVAAALAWLHRRRPGDVGKAVVLMIGAIALLDAIALAGAGRSDLAFVAVLCFVATLLLQRWVPGT